MISLEQINTAFIQALNVWRNNHDKLLSQIEFKDEGTGNRQDQYGDLISQISIMMNEINRKILLFKIDKKKLKEATPKKLDDLDLF